MIYADYVSRLSGRRCEGSFLNIYAPSGQTGALVTGYGGARGEIRIWGIV